MNKCGYNLNSLCIKMNRQNQIGNRLDKANAEMNGKGKDVPCQ